MVEGLDYQDSEPKGRPSDRFDGSESADSNYRGAIPVENRGHVERVADSYEDINIVAVDGIAHVYGNRIKARQFAEDIGTELFSYERAQEEEPVDTASVEDVASTFGDFFASAEEQLESNRAMTDGGTEYAHDIYSKESTQDVTGMGAGYTMNF